MKRSTKEKPLTKTKRAQIRKRIEEAEAAIQTLDLKSALEAFAQLMGSEISDLNRKIDHMDKLLVAHEAVHGMDIAKVNRKVDNIATDAIGKDILNLFDQVHSVDEKVNDLLRKAPLFRNQIALAQDIVAGDAALEKTIAQTALNLEQRIESLQNHVNKIVIGIDKIGPEGKTLNDLSARIDRLTDHVNREIGAGVYGDDTPLHQRVADIEQTYAVEDDDNDFPLKSRISDLESDREYEADQRLAQAKQPARIFTPEHLDKVLHSTGTRLVTHSDMETVCAAVQEFIDSGIVSPSQSFDRETKTFKDDLTGPFAPNVSKQPAQEPIPGYVPCGCSVPVNHEVPSQCRWNPEKTQQPAYFDSVLDSDHLKQQAAQVKQPPVTKSYDVLDRYPFLKDIGQTPAPIPLLGFHTWTVVLRRVNPDLSDPSELVNLEITKTIVARDIFEALEKRHLQYPELSGTYRVVSVSQEEN